MTAIVSGLDQIAFCADTERQVGFEMGVEAVYQAGQVMLPGARIVWKHPRWTELEGKRGEVITTGCDLRSCAGRCSRCVRAGAVQANQKRYGSEDFPGVGKKVTS